MKTWNAKTKAHWIETMQMHQDADHLAQGLWWSDNTQRGCFFGCAMQGHPAQGIYQPVTQAAEVMHLPLRLICLAEEIFEALPLEDAKLFPVQLCKAIPCDTNITYIYYELSPDSEPAVDRAIELIKKLKEIN